MLSLEEVKKIFKDGFWSEEEQGGENGGESGGESGEACVKAQTLGRRDDSYAIGATVRDARQQDLERLDLPSALSIVTE